MVACRGSRLAPYRHYARNIPAKYTCEIRTRIVRGDSRPPPGFPVRLFSADILSVFFLLESSNMLEAISAMLDPPHIRQILSLFRWMFCILSVVSVFSLGFHFAPYRIGYRTRMMLFPILFSICAVAILAYQASWQLAGYTRKEFVRFMERYNPRPDNAAHHLIRGSILDCKNRPLAFTEQDGSGTRVYPYEAATAHIVGFRHPSEGLTGMENAGDPLLSGYHRITSGKEWREASLKSLDTTKSFSVGTNLTLTIDARLQLRAYSLLKGRKGAAVAIEPSTGAIRLLCSSPAFDPNQYDRRLNIDPDAPLLNRALHGRYPAGSTFKTLIAALMVECGVQQTLPCPADGYYAPGARRPIRDHEYYAYERRGLAWPGFGSLDLDTALAKSSNTYFARAGVLCGVDAFNDFSARLHVNERLPLYTNGTQMVSCQRGNIPFLKRGERRELAQLSIGQGRLLVTPLHMAMFTAAIANGGALQTPRLLESQPIATLSRLTSAATARRVTRAMRKAVQSGTARKADLPGLSVCGKTGTAQNPGGEDHAWFICFAPAENPQIAIAVIVENAGFGSAEALPVAVGILDEFFTENKQ